MRPVIGITSRIDAEETLYSLPSGYARAVDQAGGLAVILTPPADEAGVADLLERVDGIILSGGVDVDPSHFGEEPHPALGEVSPRRDGFELALARAALAGQVPLLGICRGIQVLAIAAGGTVYQDIGSEIKAALKHRQQAPRWHPTHSVNVRAGSRLAGLVGAGSFRVNSFHHQAVRAVPDRFIVTAEAEDGVIEAIEGSDARFAVGVQWHPELMWDRHPIHLELFRALVENAAAARKERSGPG